MSAAAGPLFLFQVIGDDRLRAVSWDGARNGVVGARISVPWTQSPDGSRYATGGTVYEADGRAVGAVPWGAESFRWQPDGRALCAAVPLTRETASAMTLATAVPGGPVHVVASGFTPFSDNAGYPVLACDPKSDRAIVGQFGQGLYAGRMFVFRLSTGELIRSADLGQGLPATSWVAASTDGALTAESRSTTMTGVSTTVVRRADDGAALATIEGLEARGFSGDGKMLYGFAGDGRRRLEVLEWKTKRVVWVADGYQYNAFHAEPAGSIVAVPTGFDAPLTQVQLYLVLPDGTSKILTHVNGGTGF